MTNTTKRRFKKMLLKIQKGLNVILRLVDLLYSVQEYNDVVAI